MKLLITGGSGFIGSHVVRAALGRGDQVLNIDCETYAASDASVLHEWFQGDYQHIKENITNRAAMRAAIFDFTPDAILHLAAESHVDNSISSPAEFVDTNLVGTSVLLDEALRFWRDTGANAAFRFLHVSTDEVFGALGADGRFDEGSNYQPNSPYSASKAGSDMLARAYFKTYGLPVLISNCSNNYGPNQHDEKLIPTIIRKSFEGDEIPIYGSGENIRDWLYVGDHIDALFRQLDAAKPGAQYLVGGGTEITNLKLAEKLRDMIIAQFPNSKATGSNVAFVQDRAGHDFRYAIDASKIERDLGWTAQTQMDAGLHDTITWYAQKYGALE